MLHHVHMIIANILSPVVSANCAFDMFLLETSAIQSWDVNPIHKTTTTEKNELKGQKWLSETESKNKLAIAYVNVIARPDIVNHIRVVVRFLYTLIVGMNVIVILGF